MAKKFVYFFSKDKSDGNATMKNILGGKGANLAEMCSIGVPVPPGFTISTEVCDYYYKHGRKYPTQLQKQIDTNIATLERVMGAKLGDSRNPLLVSVRSGAAVSMPGMMDTVLNLGLNDDAVIGLGKKTGNERLAWDAYRRFIDMFGNVVMGVDHDHFEEKLTAIKKKYKVKQDNDLTATQLKELVGQYKNVYKQYVKKPFPTKAKEQLMAAVNAVFGSWNIERAVIYRRINKITGLLGTAVNVQAMVFGNMGNTSGTGVAFTRNPSNGDKEFFGEFLINAQGEDVVAGIRTPEPIDHLKKKMPKIYKQLDDIRKKLEKHYRDIQDVEFTIQEGKLFMLQTRTGKRTGLAAVKIAYDMVGEKMITPQEALLRIQGEQLNQLLFPIFDPLALSKAKKIAKGLPAGPGAASGHVVFTADDAQAWKKKGKKVILVRHETSPEDVAGMDAAEGILTSTGGMTCISANTLVLTNEGFLNAEEAFKRLKNNGRLKILSYNAESLQPTWKKVVAAGRRKSKVIKIAVSQSGRTKHNFLEITPEHKIYTFQNRKLTKVMLSELLKEKGYVCLIDKIPQLQLDISDEKLAYLAGAILTDGHINLRRTKGSVTFTQKKTNEKLPFIAKVESCFEDVFGVRFSYSRTKTSNGYLRGRCIQGEATDFISFKKKPAKALNQIKENLVLWVLGLDKISCLNFLAGLIDGDGTFHSYENSRIMIYISKKNILEAAVLACLKLGIVPQVTVNRNIYNVQILEKLNEILPLASRVKGNIRSRTYSTRLFSTRGLFSDIIDEVNFMGRPKQSIKRNLLMGAEKIERDILPICCPNPIRPELERVLNSNLRMYRAKKIEEKDYQEYVYNFEVDSKDEISKNFIVFTNMYTPLLVSNSHAAVVARGWGKCCIAGCSALNINYSRKQISVGGVIIKEGDYLSLNGATGEVMLGAVKSTTSPVISGIVENNPTAKKSPIYKMFVQIMKWADQYRQLKVRTNADTPKDSMAARRLGAEGIGLTRTEHMFFEGERIWAVREFILAQDSKTREAALKKLLPYQRKDFEGIFKEMDGLPVTIRLLDPPLHEFLPNDTEGQKEMAKRLKISPAKVEDLVKKLHELNPMLGHRGCRLSITYPELCLMQTTAIIEAACNMAKAGIKVIPEIMIPLIGTVNEFDYLEEIVRKTAKRIINKSKLKVEYTVGTMIEIPRAALTADKIAAKAEFFSFGTNDLTQMTFGYSRDDAGVFLPEYIEKKILPDDPFQTIDQEGVGQLVETAVRLGRKTNKKLKCGICGEHGGDPESVKFCHKAGLDYVSCSPYRVPIARLAAAQIAIQEKGRSRK